MSKEKPASRPLTSSELLRLAHDRLEQIVAEMEARQDYGTAGLELNFERGQIQSIRRTLSGYDKPAHARGG
jgi:hypothetical protein